MPTIINPKVFISYSWKCQERVIQLAERLISHGVDVIIDVWNLQEGQDKYAFMEQAVTNAEIDKVIIICDKSYMEKADSRKGGVGDEAMIISPEIYGQAEQKKFIPVIFEFDEDSNACCPTFIKARIYIDLSTDDEKYESEYEKLLRNIYEKPTYRKPKIGDMPEWLENEEINFSKVRDIIKQIHGYRGNNSGKKDYLIKQAKNVFATALFEYKLENPISEKTFLTKIDEHKILRDLYFDLIEELISTGFQVEEVIPDFFEELYNKTHVINDNLNDSSNFENIDFFIWESFIGTIAILLYYEKYQEINSILKHTYFLRSGYYSGASINPHSYVKFRKHMDYIERICKPHCENPRYYSLASEILIKREKKPIITKNSLIEADIFLYQLFYFLDFGEDSYSYWFPNTYVYARDIRSSMWLRLKSQKYCEKILPLFGLRTIDEFKKKLSQTERPEGMRYGNSFDAALWITENVKISEIGILN